MARGIMDYDDGTIDPQKLLQHIPAVGHARTLSSNGPPKELIDANSCRNQKQNALNALFDAGINGDGDPIVFQHGQNKGSTALPATDPAVLSTVFSPSNGIHGYLNSLSEHRRDLFSTEVVHDGTGCATDGDILGAFFDPLAQYVCSNKAISAPRYGQQFLPLLDAQWSSGIADQAPPHQVNQFDGVVSFNSNGVFNYSNSNYQGISKVLAQTATSACWLPLSDDSNLQMKNFDHINQACDAESVESRRMDFENPILSHRRLSEPLVHTVDDPRVDFGMDHSFRTKTSLLRRHSDKLHQKPSLRPGWTFIMESGNKSQGHKNPLRIKGRRSGPLAESVRQNARKVREQKSICIRCRKDRQPVSLLIGSVRAY